MAAPEAANNADAQCKFIPMLTLGLPASGVMALMLGALTIQGIQPGPEVMTQRPDLFWGLVASMWIGNLMLVVLNLPMIGLWVKLLQVPYRLLFPAIMAFSAIGIYSVNRSSFEIYLTAAFGIFGFVCMKLGFPMAPMLLGYVLGPMMEENLRRSMLQSGGDPTVFVTRPLSLVVHHRHGADPDRHGPAGGAPAARRDHRLAGRVSTPVIESSPSKLHDVGAFNRRTLSHAKPTPVHRLRSGCRCFDGRRAPTPQIRLRARSSTTIYNSYKGQAGNGISLDSAATIRRYFEPALAALIIKDQKEAESRGDAPALDGDPFVDAQDWEIKSFDIAIEDLAANKARATVKFQNFDKARTVSLDLIKLREGWRIADITWQRDGESSTLRALFAQQ